MYGNTSGHDAVTNVDDAMLYTLRSFDERNNLPGGMQEARYESGLDNSPMYDCKNADQQGDQCEFFDRATGTMSLLDVGMSSMAAQEAYALATLADVINRTEGTMLRKRGRFNMFLAPQHSCYIRTNFSSSISSSSLSSSSLSSLDNTYTNTALTRPMVSFGRRSMVSSY